jgi:hypothetical protein
MRIRKWARLGLGWISAAFLMTGPVPSAYGAASTSPALAEPNLKTAEQWWPDLTDYWTPVGWKHHRFRYNVFFDGTIYADPALSQTAQQWEGQGVQIRVQPIPGNVGQQFPRYRGRYFLEDDNSARQGWSTNQTPVLWTEWSRNGLLLHQHIFAHTPGSKPVQNGLEPLFAWVRLSVHDTCPGLPVPKRYGFALQLNAPHVRNTMAVRRNIVMVHEKAPYPRALTSEEEKYDRQAGFRVLEPDGKVRLGIAPGADVEARFLPAEGDALDPLLYIGLEARPGNYVDVLVPMLPTERAVFDQELANGYQAALNESEAFWAQRPQTAAVIDVPETYINDTLRQFERFAEVLSERVPETGRNVTLSGSLVYVRVWATPTGKLVSMFLDPLGYHDLAGEYIEPFIEAQGTRKPPSKFLDTHPGYLGSPESFKSIDWMADHGSLLFAIANHALMASDPELKKRYVNPAVKACEFIQHARRVKGHGGVEGILPPARYSDRADMTQGVWSDGWNYKGLVTAARFLRQVNHPRAAEFTSEADDYKRTYLAAFRKAAAKTDTWTDSQGNVHQFVPTSLHGAVEESARHGFYLDTGPMILVFAGLLDVDDPLMKSALKWFREGPVQRYAHFGWNHYQVGFLRHEMSSSIPGYSWNVFHNHQSGDRKHYLEAMYSQYAGAISRQTKTVCESRGGVTGRITHADTPFYLARLAVVDDLIADNELHLLRICPLAWISSDRETKFEKMPTAYGPVSLRWRLSEDGKMLRLGYNHQFHQAPRKVILHIPPVGGLNEVVINGKSRRVAPGEKIEL